MNYYVYIITNKYDNTFYIGITNNLTRRLQEHTEGTNDGFTKKYKINKLVYYETFNKPEEAINREKQLKNWHRNWKINLIKEVNPNFEDLSKDWE